MEIRRNPITGAPVLFAPDRARRPDVFEARRRAVESRTRPPFDTSCPFCPGNEAETPPEVSRRGEPWRVRAFPNRYPFATHHEVIVESAAHDASFASISHAADVVSTWIERLTDLRSRPGVEHVALFKNEGAMAGASLEHLHSQVAALPFVPPRVTEEVKGFRSAARCPLCDLAAAASPDLSSPLFACVSPAARMFADELWLIPRTHRHDATMLTDAETEEMSALLQKAAAKMARLTDSQNWLLLDFPREPRAHVYLQLIPRLAPVAGFELATGTFVDTTREAR